jgi:hypothetical protein
LPIFPLSIGSTATHQAVVVADGVPPVRTGISSKDAVAPPDDDVGVIATPVIASTPQRATVTDGLQ